MKKHILPILLLMLVALTVSPVIASHHYKGMGHGCMMNSWNMNEMDANQDEMLSFEEYSDRLLSQLKMGFDMIDTDKDGVISAAEWEAFLTVHGVKSAS